MNAWKSHVLFTFVTKHISTESSIGAPHLKLTRLNQTWSILIPNMLYFMWS